MESDKSVYAMVAVFALVFFIVMGIIVVYIFNIIVTNEKANVKDSRANSLFVALGRAVEKTFVGQDIKFVAERFIRIDNLPQNDAGDSGSGEVRQPSNPITEKVPVCGDGFKDKNEECDDGSNDEVCGYNQFCRFCDSSCHIVNVPGSYCGDNITNGNEECDDGNLISGDGCSAFCKNESSRPADYCRDSDVTGGYLDGKNVFVKGNVSMSSQEVYSIYYDTCLSGTSVLEYYCLNTSIKRESIDCSSGYECFDGKCAEKIVQAPPITFVSSSIPDGAIDARIPYQTGNPSSIYGWSSVTFTFSGNAQGLSLSNFSMSGVGSAVSPKISSAAQGANQNEVVLTFDKQMSPGNRAVVSYTPENKKICLGYLPGDVNGDGVADSRDLLDFIDAVGGTKSFPIYSLDVDRSGTFAPADQLTYVDLQNGIYGELWGKSLPPCVCSSDGQCSSGYACQSGVCVQVSGSPYLSFWARLRIWLFGP